MYGMCDGCRQVAYYGRGDKVVEYFSQLGLHCSPHYNPADFISNSLTHSFYLRLTVTANQSS